MQATLTAWLPRIWRDNSWPSCLALTDSGRCLPLHYPCLVAGQIQTVQQLRPRRTIPSRNENSTTSTAVQNKYTWTKPVAFFVFTNGSSQREMTQSSLRNGDTVASLCNASFVDREAHIESSFQRGSCEKRCACVTSPRWFIYPFLTRRPKQTCVLCLTHTPLRRGWSHSA